MSPAFTWPGEHGSTQWVQYTFPNAQEVSTVQVHWATGDTNNPAVRVPASWRVQYQQGSSWSDVQATTPYGVEPDVFNRVDFAPVKTTALRLEVTMAPDAGVGINEWRVGPERIVGSPKDLKADESFTLKGDVLEWTLKIANQSAEPVEIGDLALPMSMAEGTPQGRNEIYTQKLIRHSSIGGNGSWVYWQRANAEGPFLVLVPQGNAKIEYTGTVAVGGDSGERRSGRARWRRRSGRRRVYPVHPRCGVSASARSPGARKPVVKSRGVCRSPASPWPPRVRPVTR